MDLALEFNPDLQAFDIAVDALAGDFAQEDTLATAVVLSLLCDSLAQAHEVPAGQDRRGWWADVFASDTGGQRADSCGSRLWLLAREKQLPQTATRVRAFVEEALQWLVDDGLATGLVVTVFAPRLGWYTALVDLQQDGQSRRFRFEWDADAQVWRVAGERA